MRNITAFFSVPVVGFLACASSSFCDGQHATPPDSLSYTSPAVVAVGTLTGGDFTSKFFKAEFTITKQASGLLPSNIVVMGTKEASKCSWRPPTNAILVLCNGVNKWWSAYGNNGPRSIIEYNASNLAEVVRRANSPALLSDYLRTEPELTKEEAVTIAEAYVKEFSYATNFLPAKMENLGVGRGPYGWHINFWPLPTSNPGYEESWINVQVLDSGEIGYTFEPGPIPRDDL